MQVGVEVDHQVMRMETLEQVEVVVEVLEEQKHLTVQMELQIQEVVVEEVDVKFQPPTTEERVVQV